MPSTTTRRGRPPKPPQEGERIGIGFRVTPALKRKIEAAAKESGRSQSQEIEFRLERSFEQQEMAKEVAKEVSREVSDRFDLLWRDVRERVTARWAKPEGDDLEKIIASWRTTPEPTPAITTKPAKSRPQKDKPRAR
jgi:hypothetical protein